MTISHVSELSEPSPAVPPPVYFPVSSYSIIDVQENYTLDL